ncbi:retinol dehydrogenase 12-like [Pollicipes pollicipes]|uniref:retinol dehydrogenase 12-like n=1 Tax=Pollicipes pollicipes TaxID=41117 RepID=UPI0018849A19|nr:retinol dehydrogenase 12-like [Pollicipes pollicipes]XP_037072430.1 retinol dehydrogenase 12-like [Pollicipes pollicipes]XP_037073025.1 retinol dehydrogenase 12-like [Pollicipes pollicipes]
MDYLPLLGGLIGAVAVGVYIYRRARVAGETCDCTDRVDGKVVLVSGANCGIGRQVARELALRGARVYLACRSRTAARQAADSIINETSNTSVRPLQLDLNSLASVRRLVHEFRQVESQLDILINNAGCFYCPPSLTEDGFTVTFQTNYLGKDICVNSVDPGNVNTDIYRHYRELNTFHVRLLRRLLMRTPWEGAQTVIHCAVSSKIDGVTGQYFRDCTIADANPLVRDRALAQELWRTSERWTGLSPL